MDEASFADKTQVSLLGFDHSTTTRTPAIWMMLDELDAAVEAAILFDSNGLYRSGMVSLARTSDHGRLGHAKSLLENQPKKNDSPWSTTQESHPPRLLSWPPEGSNGEQPWLNYRSADTCFVGAIRKRKIKAPEEPATLALTTAPGDIIPAHWQSRA